MLCQLTLRAKHNFGDALFTSLNRAEELPSSVTFLYENTSAGHITAKKHWFRVVPLSLNMYSNYSLLCLNCLFSSDQDFTFLTYKTNKNVIYMLKRRLEINRKVRQSVVCAKLLFPEWKI